MSCLFSFPSVCKSVSVSSISSQVDFILITHCFRSPVVQKIVIPAQQQGKKSRDPQRDEFIRSVGQLGQLIMLLSWRQEGVERREEGAEIETEGMAQRENGSVR